MLNKPTQLLKCSSSQRARLELLLAFFKKSDSEAGQIVQLTGQYAELVEPAMTSLVAMLGDPDSEARERAVMVLGEIGDARAVEPLLAKLQDGSERVCKAADYALGRMVGLAHMTPAQLAIYYVCTSKPDEAAKIGEPAVEPLIAKLGDGSWKVRSDAVSALGKIGGARAVESLIGELEDRDTFVRYHAAEALGNAGDSRAVEALIKSMGDENGDVRRDSAGALGKLGDARAVDALINLLGDGYKGARQAAIEALAKIDGARTVDLLIGLLSDRNPHARAEAAEVLGKIGGVPAVEPLIWRMGDGDPEVRREAAYALGRIGDTRAVETLIWRMACDANETVRCDAICALGFIGDARAVEPLIGRLGDGQQIRSWAALALGKLGDARSVESLISLLGDGKVRKDAAEALGQIGDARAIEPLEKLLSDEDRRGLSGDLWVEVAASNALKKIKDTKEAVKGARAQTVRYGEGHGSAPVVTSVQATVDVGLGNALYLRGDGPGLNWERGMLMENTAADTWAWVTLSASRAFTYKTLLNDTQWSTGENCTAAVGVGNASTPRFNGLEQPAPKPAAAQVPTA